MSSAYCKQYSVTGQWEHTDFARSIWSTAGPVLPTGKNSSGSTVRQAALSLQSTEISLSIDETAPGKLLDPPAGIQHGEKGYLDHPTEITQGQEKILNPIPDLSYSGTWEMIEPIMSKSE